MPKERPDERHVQEIEPPRRRRGRGGRGASAARGRRGGDVNAQLRERDGPDGAVDRTDWKGYILPLLFFKRISDVWDEETTEAAETYGDVDPAAFPEVHRFSVPEGCHWRDVRETAANVGSALLHAMQEIERANPDTLYRVFGTEPPPLFRRTPGLSHAAMGSRLAD